MNPLGGMFLRHAIMLNPLLETSSGIKKSKVSKQEKILRVQSTKYLDVLFEQIRIKRVYKEEQQKAYKKFIQDCRNNKELWVFICKNYDTIRELLNDLPRLLKEETCKHS